MNDEETRLRTFRVWNCVVESTKVAAAGFYYIGPNTLVKCFCCGIEVRIRDCDIDVTDRHREVNPSCLFVLEPEQTSNVAFVPEPSPLASNEQDGSNIEIPTIGHWETHSSVYRDEQARLDSFTNWPIPFIVRPEALAAAGFYYLRHGDKVACAFCTGVVERWERGDVPMDEHKRHFPKCPFIAGIPVGNIRRITDPNRLAELGIQPHWGPWFPKFSTVESRLKTFDAWPPDTVQKPSDLAQAGFFHQSSDNAPDQVRCFHCSGALRHWEPMDIPWKEHALWFPKCPFLLLVKGQHFVNNIQTLARGGTAAATVNTETESETEKTSRGLPSGLSSSLPSLVEPEAVTPVAAIASSSTGAVCSETLEEENRRLKEARTCKICMDAEIGTVLLPCGHFVACVGCAPSLLDCPICRVTIKATVRTYLT